MRKFIILLILPIIGFSQCEDPILDKILQDSNVNQYFQLAISLNVTELQFLNDCNADINYTMFVPGNDLPNESASLLLGLGGELIDYISYYTHPESIEFSNISLSADEGLCTTSPAAILFATCSGKTLIKFNVK